MPLYLPYALKTVASASPHGMERFRHPYHCRMTDEPRPPGLSPQLRARLVAGLMAGLLALSFGAAWLLTQLRR